jgi:uncharacterized protein YbaR (Trm112 family)
MPLGLDMPKLLADEQLFICPQTKLPLRAMSLEEAKQALGSNELVPRANAEPEPFGVTATLMVRSDNQCAYPVADGIPILLAPEQITTPARQRAFDLKDVKYAEAYEEMTYYNKLAMAEAENIRESQAYQVTEPALRLSAGERASFPEPKEAWLDCVPDCKAQHESYCYLLPIKGQRLLQIGGKGIHAVKFLLAGCAEAWVVTPMLGEVYCAIALANEAGVLDRLRVAVAVAEETPIADNTFDRVYSAGSVHHMTTELALPEIARVLKPGGRFSCFDPWRAPFYKIGTKILGKREVSVFCRPLTKQRVSPLFTTFNIAKKAQYGALTRYAGLALNKFGIGIPFRVWWQLYRFDDGFCSCIPGLRNLGSSVALFGTKEQADSRR